jgi:prepilin-type N-terminal cleavage/methylation domain-containing protein
MKTAQRGYSLVELSVVLLALGLVIVGLAMYWQQTEGLRVKAVQASVQQQAKDAAVGFMYARYRLACPAIDANGLEDCGSAANLNAVGFVPWRTLGMANPAAGQLRYGVYRAPNATDAHLDQDLGAAKDRMNPLRARTPNPAPTNGRAPNGNTPPAPDPAENLLGHTYSGNWNAPLNTNCIASNPVPCPATATSSSANMIDMCLALNRIAGQSAAPAGSLAVSYASGRRPVAFVIASPGLLDADANGNAFDGLNASASNASPTFEPNSREASSNYDDQVMVVSALELFSLHSCAAGLAAISHSHMNLATSGFMMERAYYDFRDQLDVQVLLAGADVAASLAGTAGAAAGVVAGATEIVAATGDTTLSAGARSFQIALSIAATVVAGIGVAAALVATGLSAAGLVEAQAAWDGFAANTTAMTTLATSIANNALTADAFGF